MGSRGELHAAAGGLLNPEWRPLLRQIESSAPAEIAEETLPELLEHALTRVPYYRDLGVPEPRLDLFPLLTRETLRTQFRRLQRDDLRRTG